MGPICHLFNLSFKTLFLPTILKTAKIVPIFKAGETHNFTNYRPIYKFAFFVFKTSRKSGNKSNFFMNLSMASEQSTTLLNP